MYYYDPSLTSHNPLTTLRSSDSAAVMSSITRSKGKDLIMTAEGEVRSTGADIPDTDSITTKLPTELLIEVLSYVDMKTLLLAQRVNSDFRAIIQTSPILRRCLWLEPSEQIIPAGPKCTWHTTCQCPRGCNLMEPSQVIVNPLMMHVLDMGNQKHILPMERFLKDQKRVYSNDELDKCESAKAEFMKRYPPKSDEARVFWARMHDAPLARASKVGSLDLDVVDRKLREKAFWQGKASSALRLAELKLTMSTVKHCLELVDDKVEHSWKNMIVFQGASGEEFTMNYNVIEYKQMYNSMKGRFPREHSISAGRFGGKITVSELIAVLKERHRDIHMLE